MSYPRVGLGSAIPSLSATNFPSMARRIGRFFPPQGAANIVPRVVAWTTVTDAFGIAYPAGLVGVVYTNAAGGVYSDSAVQAAFEAAAFAVPGVLPSGYTLRLARDLFPGVGGCVNQLAGGIRKVRTVDGFANLAWYPEMVVGAGSSIPPSTNLAGTAANIAASLNISITTVGQGWRNLGVSINLNASSGIHMASGTSTYRISHNADGSLVGGTGDGDTIDATWTVNATDFVAGSGPGGSYSSPKVDLGAILPTLGKRSNYVVRVLSNSMQDTGGTVRDPIGVNKYQSLRVDIPLPFTCTGRGGDIAPGGVIPGSVPGY